MFLLLHKVQEWTKAQSSSMVTTRRPRNAQLVPLRAKVLSASELRVTVRGRDVSNSRSAINFHIRLTNRMHCATDMLISLDVSFNKVPWLQTPSSSHTLRTYLWQANSAFYIHCSQLCKYFYVPKSAIKNKKIRILTLSYLSVLKIKTKTLTDFHEIWYYRVLLRFLKEFQFWLNSHNYKEYLAWNLQVYLW